jgi:hypothetical protein
MAQHKATNDEFQKWARSLPVRESLDYWRGMLALVQKLGLAPASPVSALEMEPKELLERLEEAEANFRTPGKYTDVEQWRLWWAQLEGWRRYQRGESVCE